MKRKILIIGSNGQIGSELIKALGSEDVIPLTHKDIEITDHAQTRQKIENIRPDIIINTAAFHKTDECEKEIEKAFAVNTLAVENLVNICKDNEITLVHFSTDYVFDGKKISPYTEEDKPAPLNIYGISKLNGEYLIRTLKKYFLIRTAYVFGLSKSTQKKTNLVETFLNAAKMGKINAVSDHIFSPTYAEDLAQKVAELLNTKEYGLYHITNQGECSIYEFALKICELENLAPIIEKTTMASINLNSEKAKRPLYSALTSINLKKVGISPIGSWEDGLSTYLKKRKMIQTSNLNINEKISPTNKKIIGVELIKRDTHSDDRGHLTEIYRVDEPYHQIYGGPLRQVYIVENEEKSVIRAFHKHKELWDFFYISHGSAKFILIDDRPESETYGAMNVFVLSRMNKALLIVPPGVFHGWMSLTSDTQLVSIASHTYNRENPDESRIPPDSFGTEWEVKGK